MEDSHIAVALSHQLAEKIGAQRFELWFTSQARLGLDGLRLTIHAANEFVRDWIRGNLGDDIRTVWQSLAGNGATVNFSVETHCSEKPLSGVPAATKGQPQLPAVEAPSCSSVAKAPRRSQAPADSTIRNEMTLKSFVVGRSNEYAFIASQLSGSGRQQASPVLLCGPTGVGKTHLLRAIASEHRRANPRRQAVYLTAEQFTTTFIEALRGSGLPSFRQKCRGADLLIIDDLQFFLGKDRTLEELQYTIDTLIADGRQVVLASDRPIAELRGLGAELQSRIAGGLTCEIAPPEFATRLEIVRRVSSRMGLVVEDDVLSAVAAQINAGARELCGALHRLQATSLAYDQPVTREMAERAMADLVRHSTRTVRLTDVQKAVCDVFGVEPSQLRSEHKTRSISEPRLLAMWLARKYTRSAWSDIAQFFGRRSHSTVISAHRRVEKLISDRGKIGLSDRTCGVEEAIRKLESALRTA